MKVNILSEYFFSLDDESLPLAVLFFSNRIFPRGSKFVMNIGFSTIIQVLTEIASLEILSNMSFKEPIIASIYKLVSSEEEMFEKGKDSGHEGLVLKDPQSHYHPGKR
jgi:hypothetical protein